MRVTRIIRAPRPLLYRALVDADALVKWLPPRGMHASMHRFDAREGGGYRMTLFYDRPDEQPKGKTRDDADVVEARFVRLMPDRLVELAVDFESDDAAFAGTMSLTWTLTDVDGGCEVAVESRDEPPGVRPDDHETGMRSSLENLAAFVGVGRGA